LLRYGKCRAINVGPVDRAVQDSGGALLKDFFGTARISGHSKADPRTRILYGKLAKRN